MRAILSYVKKIVASEQDGTICMQIQNGDFGTITIKNKSIAAASLGGALGQTALDQIKTENVIHMEFWPGITRKKDIERMIEIQAETHEIAPIPAEELYPEGATLPSDLIEAESIREDLSSQSVSNDTNQHARSGERTEILTKALAEYVGPAAQAIVEDAESQAADTDALIRVLSEELIDDNEVVTFTQKAYMMLAQR